MPHLLHFQPKKSVLKDIQSEAAGTSKVSSSTDALSLAASLGNNDDDNEKENEINSNDNTTIFVEKLPATVTLDEIYNFFTILEILKWHDNTTGNKKMHYQAGKYCTITFRDSKTAALAVFQYDDHFVEKFGSTISVKMLPPGTD
ncbi:unnamed protein product [Didymodactylos carnosus]|uniref:RRM domain-containing protein n=1 Tax=Didymodactylos carnosus TaxID=1234261 RepID=A0A815CP33_9BILA|nr:unnamed protein product [Didymodactylos carnosus]CAF1329362.1 unnamed protein product [Didymodactylos carnosus]CAF4090981.1 unnamed protein product [Didymodactylos carnosus]CAF4140777.1 unnamed protein product [Didymodactylos carnosus]